MVGWVTPYQRSFAPYELTLHSKELPSGIASERAALSARMNAILSIARPSCHRTGTTRNGTIILGRSWRPGTSTFQSA